MIDRYFLLILFILVCSACDINNLRTIDLIDHESSIVAVGNYIEKDSVQEIFVSTSLSNKNTNKFAPLKNAKVYLLSDDNLDTIFYNFTDSLNNYVSYDRLISNSALTLQIEHENYETVSATQKIPNEIELLNVELIENEGSLGEFGEKKDILKIEIKHNNEGNYFFLAIKRFNQLGDLVFLKPDTFQPILYEIDDYPSPGFLFSDKELTTQNITIVFDEYLVSGSTKEIIIELLSLSEDGFRYYQSLQNYFDNENNLFVEPTSVFTNIDGGYGCFSYVRKYSKSIKI